MNHSRALAVVVGLMVCAASVLACDPYQRFSRNDDSLGPVDPVNFPPTSLGTMGNRMQPGVGWFTEVAAFSGGTPVGYFVHPLPAPSPAGADALRLLEDGKPYASAVATPTVYTFDPGCAAPAGYQYDRRVDEVRLDEQGSVFTALPSATYTPGVAVSSRYTPVVAQAPVSASAVPCQKFKNEEALAARFADPPARNGQYLARLIIDPAAAVYPRDDPRGAMMVPKGLGLQRWGWYRRYLLAYLDGGVIPTAESDVVEGGAMPTTKRVLRMVAQKLYLPRSPVITTGANGATTMAAGVRGAGYDVLGARRGQPGYSPLCEVVTYDAGMPLAPDALPRDAQIIEASFGPTLQPASPTHVFCLQVEGP